MTGKSLQALTASLAKKLDMGDGRDLIETLKSTAFKGQVSDAQMTALMVVANQYGLNPWTKEIYAFPDKSNGIVPVVGVDGWARIINSHPQFDGIEFDQDDDQCTCRIYRKDRSHPTVVTEYMAECMRNTGPWKSHPRRMLRHKAMIQCARIAFGYGGIYDQDEAERIIEAETRDVTPPQPETQKAALEQQETITLDQAVFVIEGCATEEELREEAAPLCAALDGAAQAKARDVYKAKLAELKQEVQT